MTIQEQTNIIISKVIFFGVLCLVLSSCALTTPINSSAHFYQLQPMPSTLQHKMFLETLIFTKPEQRQLLTQIETDETTLSLAAMTYSGLAIMQAKWQSEKGLVNYSSQVFDKKMLLRIIQDIQLVKWPEQAIQTGLLDGYQLRAHKLDNKYLREIIKEDQIIVSIVYIQNKVILTNSIENYELVIESINE